MPESLPKMSFASSIFCYSILSKLGARKRFTRNISTIDRVMTTEYVTPQATHARYEGEAQARPSASAVFYHPKHYFVVFGRNYGLFRRIFFSSPSRRSTDSSRNNGVATKRERKAKIPLELYFLRVASQLTDYALVSCCQMSLVKITPAEMSMVP